VEAAALRRHLFGANDAPVFTVETPTIDDRNRAARLRSGLVTRVRLRAGRYLACVGADGLLDRR
jgi:hypothetical protein